MAGSVTIKKRTTDRLVLVQSSALLRKFEAGLEERAPSRKSSNAVAVVALRRSASARPAKRATLAAMCGRFAGSLRRPVAPGRSRGSKKGASVSSSKRWLGICAHELLQVRAAPLVADEAGNADTQAELQIAIELGGVAGEAVHDPAHEPLTGIVQDAQKVVVRAALVQKHWFSQLDCQLELRFERRPLLGAR